MICNLQSETPRGANPATGPSSGCRKLVTGHWRLAPQARGRQLEAVVCKDATSSFSRRCSSPALLSLRLRSGQALRLPGSSCQGQRTKYKGQSKHQGLRTKWTGATGLLPLSFVLTTLSFFAGRFDSWLWEKGSRDTGIEGSSAGSWSLYPSVPLSLYPSSV